MSCVFETYGRRAGNLLLVGDHASNFIPPWLENLGLEAGELQRHIAYDIGTGPLAVMLAQRLDARAVLAGFSRLVVDVNRAVDHAGLMPAMSDGTRIPGNAMLSNNERAERMAQFYHPYHSAVSAEITALTAVDPGLHIVSLHSFTPQMNGDERPWHVSVLFNQDDRLATALADRLDACGDLVVGRNEPYSGREFNYSMDYHAERHAIPYVTIEVRQDLIADEMGVERWCTILAQALTPLLKGQIHVAR